MRLDPRAIPWGNPFVSRRSSTMLSKVSFVALSLVAIAATASAQIVVRDPRTNPRVDPRTGSVIVGSTGEVSRSRAKVPPGQLPPRGMCRVWVDGVPPGQQPPVESCAQAEADRVRYGANARVIYGDQSSFPGKGKRKFKHTPPASCVTRDAVVVNGRLVDVCRDANGNVISTGSDRGNRKVKRGDGDDRDELRGRDDDDDDRGNGLDAAKSKSNGKAKGRKGDD